MNQIHSIRGRDCWREWELTSVGRLTLTFFLALLTLLTLYGLFHSPVALAGGGATTRYVAPAGEDSGSCASVASSCRTVQYAVSQASSGDDIRVAQGSYTGSLTIDKSLVLRGGSRARTGSRPTRMGSARSWMPKARDGWLRCRTRLRPRSLSG